MKLKNFVGLFVMSCSTFIIKADAQLYLENQFQKPINLKINGQSALGPLKTGLKAKIGSIDKLRTLSIKTEAALQYKDLTDEIKRLKDEAFSRKNQIAVLTIPHTENILKWKPGIITWIARPESSPTPPNKPVPLRPDAFWQEKLIRTNHDWSKIFIENIKDHNIYGPDLAKKMYLISIIKKPDGTNTKMSDIRSILDPAMRIAIKEADTHNLSSSQIETAIKNVATKTINDLYRYAAVLYSKKEILFPENLRMERGITVDEVKRLHRELGD